MTHCEEIQINIKNDQIKNEQFVKLIGALRTHGISVVYGQDLKTCLCFDNDALYMIGKSNKFCVDWAKDLKRHFAQSYKFKNEPLAKALRIKGGSKNRIVDCTLGTGKDSILLLSFGANIVAFERNINVFTICLDGHLRACEDEEVGDKFVNSFTIKYGEAVSGYKEEQCFAYFDPMYPERKKKALPRKEMQIFKEIVGTDGDIEEMFESLMEKFSGVVVKRSIRDLPIAENPVSFKGKTTRYDRY